MGLDKIIDFILSLINDFLPCFIVKVYQKCVVLRGGKTHRIKSPGFYFKIPFYDDPHHYCVVTTTIATKAQTVRTKDGKAVTVRSIIKYSISDAILLTETIYDAEDAIIDFAQGICMNRINSMDYAECNDLITINSDITKKLRNEVKKYGIYIEQQTITDFIETRNFRLFNDATE